MRGIVEGIVMRGIVMRGTRGIHRRCVQYCEQSKYVQLSLKNTMNSIIYISQHCSKLIKMNHFMPD